MQRKGEKRGHDKIRSKKREKEINEDEDEEGQEFIDVKR